MKLGILYHQFIRRGGLEGYLLKFCQEMTAAGHELHLCGVRADENFRRLAASVHLVPKRPTRAATLRRHAEESARFASRAEVDAVLGFGRTWRQDIHRAGGGCHARYSRDLPWWKRWRPLNRVELALERRLYRGGETARFVVNAPKVADELAAWHAVPAAAVRVIPTAVDTAHWQPAADRAALRAAMGLPARAPVVLFVSLDHRRKGLGVLLEAMGRLERRDVQLVVAGKPLARWQRLITAAGLDGRVREAGNVADLRPWYQAADLFVHPTHYDACANTVLQSMASGLPGIISGDDGASAFIRHGDNGWRLDDSRDPVLLAGLIEEALAANLTGIGEAARGAMLPLTWQAHVESWQRLIPEARALRGRWD